MELITFQIFALLFGLCLGSFMNVAISRMPEDRSVVSPPSACPSCDTQISPRDNIPVLSWLLLRGRCRNCGVSISPLYPTVELLVGLLCLLLFRTAVPTLDHFSLTVVAEWALYSVFISMLVGLSYIDLRHYIIPDQFSIQAIPFGLAAAWLIASDPASNIATPTLTDSAVGVAAGAGSLLAVIGTYWLVRREEGMGMGDVKLLGMIGAFLGWQAILPVILFASVIGSVVGVALMVAQGRGFRSQVPFGPFLSIGALIYLFAGHDIRSLMLI